MYHDLVKSYKDPKKLQSIGIFAGTLEIVNAINEYILGLIPGNTLSQHVFRIMCYNLIINYSFF